MSDLNRLLLRLCDADIEFVIVGGFAAMLHGSSLLTHDLDLCTALTRNSIAKLRETLRDIHPVHRLIEQHPSFLDYPEPEAELRSLNLGTDLGPIDFLSAISGVGDFQTVRANALEVSLFGRCCRVMALDDLIRAKEALGGDKEFLTVLLLRAVREKIRARSAEDSKKL